MMGDSETNEMLLKVKLDQNELNKTLAGNQRLEREIKDTADVIGQLGTSAATGVDRLNSEMDSAQIEVEALRRETVELRAELDRLDNTTVSPKFDVQGGFDSIDRVGSVGTQILGGLGASEAANTAGLIGDVAGAFTSLNPIMLGVTAVGVGVAAVFGDIQKQMEANLASAQDYAERLATNAELIASGATTADVTAQADRLRAVIDVVDSDIERLVSLKQQIEAVPDISADFSLEAQDAEFERLFAEVSDILGRPIEDLQTFQQAIDEVTRKSSDYGEQLLELNRLLVSGELAFNDAATAAALSTKAIQDTLQREQELATLRRTGTSEQIREQIAANNDLADGLTAVNERLRQQSEEAIQAGNIEEWQALTNQILENTQTVVDLNHANDELVDSILPVIELRERETALNDALTDSYSEALEATENTVKAQQQLTETTNALREAEAQAEADRAKIASELEAKKGEINDAANASILENTDKAAKERAKLLQEGEERIAEITRRSIATQANAIGRRDALAYYLAQQAEKEQIEDEKKAQQKRLDDLDDALKEQNDLVRKRADDQTKQAVKAADERLRTTNEANRKEIDLKRQANDKAINDLRNAKAAEAAIYQNVQRIAEQTGATTRAQFVNIQQTVQAGLSFIQQGFQNLFTDIARMRNGAVYQYQQPIGPTLSGQTGGSRSDNWFNTPFAFTSSQSNIPAPQRQNVLNVSINGAQTQTIDVRSRQQAVKALNEYMVGMGMK